MVGKVCAAARITMKRQQAVRSTQDMETHSQQSQEIKILDLIYRIESIM